MARANLAEARKKAAEHKAAGKKAAEETTQADATVATNTVAVTSTAPAGLTGFAQGRRHPNLHLDDLPDPIDVGDIEGPLNTDEAELLGLCDRAVIEYAIAETVALKALVNVQQRRLYRTEFDTFETYVEHRLSASRQWAYKQIDRYLVSMVLSPNGDKLLGESHARELAPVLHKEGPTAVHEVWEAAQADIAPSDNEAKQGVVTGVVLRRVRQRLYPGAPTQAPTVVPASRLAPAATHLARDLTADNRDPDAIAADLAGELKTRLAPELYDALGRHLTTP